MEQDGKAGAQEWLQIPARLPLLSVPCADFYGGVGQLIQAATSNNSSVMTLLLLLRSQASSQEALNILTVRPSPIASAGFPPEWKPQALWT